MNKQQAEQLLNDAFNQEFDIRRFLAFTKELFKKIQLEIKDCSQFIPNEFKEYITKVEKLGRYENNKKVIEILAVKLARESSKERARTMQRNFIAKWLGKYENDAALVAFYDETEDWRFSFVKMEYNLIKTEDGKVKAETDITPAKRYSYLVGKNEPNHTCKSQFLQLLINDEHPPSIDEIELAFSIENVTKEFFNRYKDLFFRLKESLDKIVDRDKHVKEEFDDKNIETIEFAKKLLGQIVFLYFLQKKGWLGVQKSSDGRFLPWGTGPKNFMRKLFGRPQKGEMPLIPYTNFFNDILEPLFYQAIAIKRPNDYYDRFNCKIPFLNGGLFEAINDYDWIETNIFIDNEIFEDILDTFDEYNFTVKEDEPLEKEVAVDPEMLGKVFENLLEVNDRKSKGAFYTPREIVHYMCQQSLINYLETNSDIPRKDLEKFINLGDFALDQTIRVQEQKKKYHGKTFDVDPRYLLPESIEKNYEVLDKLLKEIKVVDPAVGSGAFPVGMMNEIVRARSILSIFYVEERKVYDLKRETVENCLYGVDIMPSAVEICKLRFWLSLIVDETDITNIKPLPNLDHKIMCGNSLLEEFEGIKLFDDKLLGITAKDNRPELDRLNSEIKDLNINIGEVVTGKKNDDIQKLKKEISKLEKQKAKLIEKPTDTGITLTLNEIIENKIKQSQIKLTRIKNLQKQLFNEFDNDKKKSLKSELDKLEWELIEETLKEQGNQEAISKLEQYKKNKSKPFFLWKLHFLEVFQRENPGFDVVIANPPYGEIIKDNKDAFKNTYECTEGKYEIYKYFIEKGLSLLRDKAVLIYITPDTWLTLGYFKKLRNMVICKNNLKLLTAPLYNVFEAATVDTIVSLIQKDGSEDDIIVFDLYNKQTVKKIVKTACKSDYDNVINLKQTNLVIEKLDNSKNTLNDISEIWQGLIAYASKSQPREFTSEKRESPLHRKLLFGGDIGKYFISWKKSLYLKYGEWLHRPRPVYIFDKPKILVQRIRNPKLKDRIIAAIDRNKFINGTGLSNILILEEFENKYLIDSILGIINSSLINYWFSYYFHDVNIKPEQLRKIPIEYDQKIFQDIKLIVDQILSITKDDDYLKNSDKQEKVKRLEKEIDKLVYELYDLTEDEIKIVEESNKS
ncbi:MAG: TaqI-like C-terminal specificity domain-containing protein [Candidatus Micrarchaeota archaeon]|nr:Eco57I restriction-modification methylase domain-containing protein [Candidatus Micrarchaeota archaeon]MBU1887341.1 Eco57I restriction-modification methylase domain-containing protein [Candidatus Micrarchaeota archaeon]